MGRTFYAEVLVDFDWPAILAAAKQDAKEVLKYYDEAKQDGKDGWQYLDNIQTDQLGNPIGVIGWHFLGTHFSIMPSGKYWVFWACSNTTSAERHRDTAYMIALEKAAMKYGGWIETSEGDPCNLLFGCVFSLPELEGKPA